MLLSAVASLQLPEVHIHWDHVTEHLGMTKSYLSPGWRMLQPITRITQEIFRVLQSLRRFTFASRKRVSLFVVLMGVPGSGTFSRCPS